MRITVNGREYASWAEVPADVRARLRALPDADGDGIPDLLQGNLGALPASATTVTTTTVSVDDVVYDSIHSMPADVRAELEATLRAAGLFGATPPPATRPGSPAPPPRPTAGPPPPYAGHPATPRERPMLINGEPYHPDRAPKRWWQFWK